MANPFSINFMTPDTRGIFDANEGRKLADRESIQTAMKDLTSMALESRLAKDGSMTPTQKAQERFNIYSGFGDTQRAAAAKSDLKLEEQRALDRSRLLEGRAYAEGQAELTRQRALKTAGLNRAVASYQSITTRLDGLLQQRTTLAGDGEFAMTDAIKEQMQRLDTTIDALRVEQRELYGGFSADLQGQLVPPLDIVAQGKDLTTNSTTLALPPATARAQGETTQLENESIIGNPQQTKGSPIINNATRNPVQRVLDGVGKLLNPTVWDHPNTGVLNRVSVKHNTPVTVEIKALIRDLEGQAPNSARFFKVRNTLIAALRAESAKTNKVKNPDVSGRKRAVGEQPDLYNISASEWINERLEGSEFDPEPYKDPATGEPLTSTDKNWAMLIG